jgi:hypothetical protein
LADAVPELPRQYVAVLVTRLHAHGALERYGIPGRYRYALAAAATSAQTSASESETVALPAAGTAPTLAATPAIVEEREGKVTVVIKVLRDAERPLTHPELAVRVQRLDPTISREYLSRILVRENGRNRWRTQIQRDRLPCGAHLYRIAGARFAPEVEAAARRDAGSEIPRVQNLVASVLKALAARPNGNYAELAAAVIGSNEAWAQTKVRNAVRYLLEQRRVRRRDDGMLELTEGATP